jgi:hypothetical protein
VGAVSQPGRRRRPSRRGDDETSLTPAEAGYLAAARAANTLRGYRSDWAEFATWCGGHGFEPMPAAPAAVSGYLAYLAGHGAKVGTMSRRLSAIRFAHQLRNLPDPGEHARVVAVWEGIRRVHGAPPDQAPPLMPPTSSTSSTPAPPPRPGRPAAGPTSPTLPDCATAP